MPNNNYPESSLLLVYFIRPQIKIEQFRLPQLTVMGESLRKYGTIYASKPIPESYSLIFNLTIK